MATAKEIFAAAEQGVDLFLLLGGAAFGIGVLYYAAQQMDKSAGTNTTTTFFEPIKSNWGLLATLGAIGAVLMIIIPAISMLRRRGGGTAA